MQQFSDFVISRPFTLLKMIEDPKELKNCFWILVTILDIKIKNYLFMKNNKPIMCSYQSLFRKSNFQNKKPELDVFGNLLITGLIENSWTLGPLLCSVC